MNERIKELAIQAVGDYSKDDYWPFFEEELEKFAELIVAECAESASYYGNRVRQHVLKHFGVEE